MAAAVANNTNAIRDRPFEKQTPWMDIYSHTCAAVEFFWHTDFCFRFFKLTPRGKAIQHFCFVRNSSRKLPEVLLNYSGSLEAKVGFALAEITQNRAIGGGKKTSSYTSVSLSQSLSVPSVQIKATPPICPTQ
jgi:hypothetical protein